MAIKRHRKPRRSGSKIARRHAAKFPSQRVLIVCEARKTEPNYFSGWKKEHYLTSVRIVVVSGGGLTPIDTIERAVKIAKDSASDPYDAIFCVFDHDGRPQFDDAVSKLTEPICERLNIFGAYSTPCFEFFLLLHKTFSTRAFESYREIEPELKKYVPEFDKSDANLYRLFKLDLMSAIDNAQRVRLEAERDSRLVPYTLCDKILSAVLGCSSD